VRHVLQHCGGDTSLVVPSDDGWSPHLSLSRPFVLRKHHIDPFVEALRAKLSCVRGYVMGAAGGHLDACLVMTCVSSACVCRFPLGLSDTYVFTNEDSTATFVGSAVDAGSAQVRGGVSFGVALVLMWFLRVVPAGTRRSCVSLRQWMTL
jgi:hypothetical protein